MNLILFDHRREHFLPLTFTRPVCDLRFGILTIREKWERHFGAKTTSLTEAYLSTKFPLVLTEDNLFVNGTFCPDQQLVTAISELGMNECLMFGETVLAVRTASSEGFRNFSGKSLAYDAEVLSIENVWHIFGRNGAAIHADFDLLTNGRTSEPLSATNTVIGNGSIFLETGAKAEAVIFNTTNGPIYLGKDSEVMEGSIIRGPFALGDHAQVKMGAKIYGPTTVGPECRVGGEVNNSVMMGYSNKGHDGFLGNSVLGEWCNLGADTNNSNLKNNYDEVRLWDYAEQRFAKTGLQFCGLIMGDHSKSGINTMFNTGTVVGVSSNVFGSGFPRNFIPSFSWGGAAGFTEYKLDKALETAARVMERRAIELDETESAILSSVFDLTKQYRS